MLRHPLLSCLCNAVLLLTWGASHAADEPSPAEAGQPKLTAHIDVVSRYFVRGLTKTYGNGVPLGNAFADAPESDRLTPQWGVDYVHPSGWYAGYWGSRVNYSYKQVGRSYADRSITDFQAHKSLEHDLYAGYNGSIGDVGYTVGGTYYTYTHGLEADALESKLGVSYGAFGLNAQTLLRDVIWGNRGDTYWTLTFTHALPYDITLNASLGYYTYRKEGKYFGTRDTLAGTDCAGGEAFIINGCYAGATPVSSAARHLIVGLTMPVGATGLTWGLQGILGGENRFGVSQGHRLATSLSYRF